MTSSRASVAAELQCHVSLNASICAGGIHAAEDLNSTFERRARN